MSNEIPEGVFEALQQIRDKINFLTPDSKDGQEQIRFKIAATIAELYHLRRYFHLNFPVRVLVFDIDQVWPNPVDPKLLYDKKDTFRAIFEIEHISSPRTLTLEEQSNLFFLTDPIYENVPSSIDYDPNTSLDNISGRPKTVIEAGKEYVITGSLAKLTREEANAAISKQKGITSKRVRQSTHALIVADQVINNPTDKVGQAQRYGAQIISEKEFYEALGM